ncbi:MAG: carboxypeptidase regulatory-like domain-containing protein, partial [Gemmatimonadaceae bacterium]
MRPTRWCTLALLLAVSRPLQAQSTAAGVTDSLATLRVTARQADDPVPGAMVRSLDAIDEAGRAIGAVTDADGRATIRLPAGARRVLVSRLGFRADTLTLTLRAAQDTSVVVHLESLAADVEAFVVSATRTERRLEDTPLRVEVVDEEEVTEKLAMRPASIQMLLAETGGLRVQTTSPSLGNANVRVQGLRGRYALLLTDGLPLAGDGAG